MTRYIHGFMNGFHPHFPILHPPTLSIRRMAPELIMALAAVGSQYCLEQHQGLKLFHVARAIALEQVRARDSVKEHRYPFQGPADCFSTPPNSATEYASGMHQSWSSSWDYAPVETIQALFFLMAMATWGGRESIAAIQSVLAMLVRRDGLCESISTPPTWEEWARAESSRRTKLISFSFFNLHSIVLNLPSPLMISDLKLRLPCSELEWKASSSEAWQAINHRSEQPPLFQDCFVLLFKDSDITPVCSSLGSHVLIHALLQRILLIKQATQPESADMELAPGLSSSLRRALKKWQNGWELNSESSLNPLNKHGPIAFNSTALFHLAYIRLAVDISSARSPFEHDQIQFAMDLNSQPNLRRGSMLTLGARHAIAALCPPVQMGVHFVGRAPSWSVMHAVCSLDYAYILNQFLQAVTAPSLDHPLEGEEQDVLAVIKRNTT
ncbi:hypothetical protein N7530_008674 [Penicillium desertorum]|uniref:Xylanolytic transcriptional activator regulatory domain-containing protein n=1 Tax=Penicillium desertorum TaxID=1303715 RepID=A0A9W9WQC5_9EURO|nr:hypothetical protein N7530_008674 [Penicillium desertorum]